MSDRRLKVENLVRGELNKTFGERYSEVHIEGIVMQISNGIESDYNLNSLDMNGEVLLTEIRSRIEKYKNMVN
ncbi:MULTISPECIES: hypothetical protein [Bacillus subtilis group]|uniref:hypothetical protein n=1 Tax=Bacillus subtilis group TaxID=653685 RepID=UPI002B1D6E63|nr:MULTISPECIES: hypothetical protein [Bacillus subtilis group]MEA3602972.1 hypothetical protein [Bacillus subtilis]MEC2062667.1 hypothetical protein [Bacillus inaquosorum]MEC2086190.1 hypothetical protein [Bacillus inaquosorum]